MVNPKMMWKSKKLEFDWEGCLSIPGYRGLVARSGKIKVGYWDRQGKEEKLETLGFEARVIQHEIDHLDGVLFINRMKNLKSLKYWRD